LSQAGTAARAGLALVVVVALAVLGCSSSDPVAPEGSIITLSATPIRIASDGVSAIRVLVRKANGFPANEGTIVFLSTTVGSIATQLPTNSEGVVDTSLFGNGEIGIATVRANTGAAEEATIDVQVGLSATSVTLEASPSSVSENGGNIELLALVRDDVGQPLAGASVNFSAEIGTLASGGGFRTTNAQGEATDSLSVSGSNLAVFSSDSFLVGVEVAANDGSVVSDQETITVLRTPTASFSFSVSGLTVNFTDTSTGNPTSWDWSFGDGASSSQQNPSHTYAAAGSYEVKLTASNSLGASSVTQTVTVN
jgi:chitodextrinase